MIKKLLLMTLCLLCWHQWSYGQCSPDNVANTVVLPNAPIATDCSEFIQSPYQSWSNEAYLLNGIVEGQTYVVDLCDATAWEVVMGVYDENNELLASDDGTESGCDLGAQVTFTATSSGQYTITVGVPDCSSNSDNNGTLSVFNNTDGVDPCPGSTCSLEAFFVEGLPGNLQASEFPFPTCPTDWGADQNFNPATVFIAVAPTGDNLNGPFLVTATAGQTYEVITGVPVADDNLILENNNWGVLGFTQDDIGEDITISFSSVSDISCTASLTLDPGFLAGTVQGICPASDFTCSANAGMVTPPATLTYTTAETTMAPMVSGQTMEDNYNYFYVLTTDLNPNDNTSYNIITLNETGVFDLSALGLTAGAYNVHGLSFFGTSQELVTLGVSSGEAVLNAIEEDEICADLLVPGYTFLVAEENTCNAIAGSVTPPANTTVELGNESEAPSVIGQTSDGNFTYLYVLTTDLDPTDNITYDMLSYNPTGVFDFEDFGAGTYNVHGLSIQSGDVATLLNGFTGGTITSGEDVLAAIEDEELCADLIVPGYVLNVEVDTYIESLVAENLQVSPIPANHSLNISFEASVSETIQINLIDVTGKILDNQTYRMLNGSNNLTLDLQDFATGIYFLQLKQGNKIQIQKIIKG